MRSGYPIPEGAAEAEGFFTQRRCGWKLFFRILSRSGLAVGFGLLGVISLLASSENTTAPASSGLRAEPKLDPEYGVGKWIWAAETRDEQTCRFWRPMEIPQNAVVTQAVVTITADNAYHLFLDGREIGQGVTWYKLNKYDVTRILGPGTHVLAVDCFNEYLEAGLVAGLRVELEDGRSLEVPSDESWKIVPNDERSWMRRLKPDPHWPAATVKWSYGEGPWKRHEVHITNLPPILPNLVTFWQSGWFRIVMFSICASLAALCLLLVGKLAVFSQAQQVVRRERARIARDIHDDLTAGLTQLVLFGEVSQSQLPEGSAARREVAKVCEKARGLSRAMNEVIWMVNSQRDTFRDFTSYVCKYAETFLQGTPILCRFDVEEDLPDLPCDLGMRRNLLLGVKEALNNVVRHSGASEVMLGIHWREQRLVVAVEDDGHGFDPAAVSGQGNGLPNMTTRAAEAGGVCRIISQPGAGCRVEFAVPRARANGKHLTFWRRQPSVPRPMASARLTKAAP